MDDHQPPSLAALEEAIDANTMAQLRETPIEPGRPLLAVDADEVLVVFAAHLKRFAAGLGVEMHLERYDLTGAFRDRATGRVFDFDEAIGIIGQFFGSECRHQEAVPGAAAALARLAGIAQIVVLTNVPRHGRAARIENLRDLGMAYPLVENTGGKGKALAWMAAKAGAPAAFVDDSPSQIESAKRRAPGVARLHFVGADYVHRIIPETAAATHRVATWAEAERILRDCLSDRA